MSIEAKKGNEVQEKMNPNLALPQLKFLLTLPDGPEINKEKAKKELLDKIKEDEMAPFYSKVASELDWIVDEQLLSSMKQSNEAQLKKFEDQLKDAETNAGETEIREALMARAEFYSRIGDKTGALETFQKVFEKSVGLGNKLDVVLYLIRLGLFFEDNKIITTNINKAKSMIEEGGDWDRRNRLKVYEAVYKMSVRDFKGAAELFLDGLATFTSTELMDYNEFVRYTIICSLVSLDRGVLQKRVIVAPEILEVVSDFNDFEIYMNSFFFCEYKTLFEALAKIEDYLKTDRFLHAHYRYYTREMRIKSYAQLLESYRSLTLSSMAESFGVTEDFIDRELSRCIASGRLNCVIDKVGGIVVTNRPDAKNAQYQAVIKQGDVLLNRVQKLSRVMNV